MAETELIPYEGSNPSAAIDTAIARAALVPDLQTAVAGKQDALTTAQLAAANSGATAQIIGSIAGKQDALTTAQLAAANSGATAQIIGSIAGKADTSAVNTALAAKADTTAVNSAMATKADTTTLNAAAANLQAQIDQIIDPAATQDAEVQNARIGADGVVYQTLKGRLDGDVTAIRKAGEVNLFNAATVKEGIFLNGTTGAESSDVKYDASDFIEVVAGNRYCIRTFSCSTESVSYRIYYYRTDKTFISRTTSRCNENPNGLVFTVPANTKYIRLNFESSENSSGRQDYHTCVFAAGNAYIYEYAPYYSAYDATTRANLAKVKKTVDDSGLGASLVTMFDNVGFLGDSFSAGVCYNKEDTQYYDPTFPPHGTYPQHSFPYRLARRYNINQTTFAKGGLTSGDFRTDSAGLPALLAAPAQDLYFIALGLNDVTQQVPLGVEADIDTEPLSETYLGNMGAIIRAIKQHAPNCRIILSKSLWVMDAGALTPNGYYTYISSGVEKLSAHLGIPYIETLDDVFFCGSAYVNGLHGLHPTVPLYAGMAERIGQLIGKCIIDNLPYFETYYKPAT